MGKKYFTLSFDDGLEQDKRIIALMKQYGLKGTFNLNSGLFGQRGEVMGLGSFSFRDCEEGVRHRWPFSYVPHNRIPEDEILQVYEGMEIASHGFRHEPLKKLDEQGLRDSVGKDKENLERLTGAPIVGHAYAQGSVSPAAEAFLKKQGYLYARAVYPSGSFEFPADPLNFRPSSSVIYISGVTAMRWTTGRDRQAGTAWSVSLPPSPASRTLSTAPTAKRSVICKGGHTHEENQL